MPETLEQRRLALEQLVAAVRRIDRADLKLTMGELLAQAARDVPDEAAFVEPDRTSLSFAGLFALAQRTIRTLNSIGYSPSSRIALALPTNSGTSVVYAALITGMTIMPMSPSATAEEFQRCFKQANVDAVLVMRGDVAAARLAAEHCGAAVIEIEFATDAPIGTFSIVGAADAPEREPLFAGAYDLALLMFTSGTTDRPKLTRFQQFLLVARMLVFLPPLQSRVFVNLLPLYHLAGAWSTLLPFSGQCTVTCVPSTNLNDIYRYLERYSPPVLPIVPALLQQLVRDAEGTDDRFSRLTIGGFAVTAAGLPAELISRFQRVFAGGLSTSYGTQEVGAITAGYRLVPQEPDGKTGAVGQPIPLVKMRIVNEAGENAAIGEVGEVQVDSPLACDGYENNPQANAEAFVDGWFRTGDSGYQDADGYLYLTARVKEVINRGGSKVSPLEIDEVLLEHPAVAEAAAFGYAHRVLGEDIAAAVVLREAGTTEQELRLFALERLAPYKVPSRIIFVDAIPRTDLGKIRRTSLAQRYADALSVRHEQKAR